MDVYIALLSLSKSFSKNAERAIPSPHDYDLVLIEQPTGSAEVKQDFDRRSTVLPRNPLDWKSPIDRRRTAPGRAFDGRTVLALPSLRLSRVSSDDVLVELEKMTDCVFRRAVPVPVIPVSSSPREDTGPFLFCVPITHKERLSIPTRVESLGQLVHWALADSPLIEAISGRLAVKIEDWLSGCIRRVPRLLPSLFLRPSSRDRIRSCAHNPAHSSACQRKLDRPGPSTASTSSELDVEVQVGNTVRVQQIRCEKYDMFVMNPLPLLHGTSQSPTYFAIGRKVTRGDPNTAGIGHARKTSGAEWQARYPLHRAAYAGDTDAIHLLLTRSPSLVNSLDADSWTALHYAAFYGHLDATRALLQASATDVNVRNKGGATPLHLAALNANAYLVELLLGHPDIDKNALNREGLRPLDLCASVPKKQWQTVAKLLTDFDRLDKIQVDLIDGSNMMLKLDSGADTSSDAILARAGEELRLPMEARRLFALWVCSSRLSLQLKPEHKPIAHLNTRKWREKLAKWAESEGAGQEGEESRPRLVLRRNAHTTLDAEVAVS